MLLFTVAEREFEAATSHVQWRRDVNIERPRQVCSSSRKDLLLFLTWERSCLFLLASSSVPDCLLSEKAFETLWTVRRFIFTGNSGFGNEVADAAVGRAKFVDATKIGHKVDDNLKRTRCIKGRSRARQPCPVL